MRLWEFPDQYVVEPTDGSSGSCLAISRVDGSINLIGWLLFLVTSLTLCYMIPIVSTLFLSFGWMLILPCVFLFFR